MSERLTLATATGLPFLALAFHFGTGLIALAAGFVAVAARKGGTWHRRSGQLFVCSMIATGVAIVGLSVYEGKSAGGGVVIIYLVLTAYTTVTPLRRVPRRVDVALMALAFTLAIAGYGRAFTALDMPGHQIDGAPAGMLFFLNTALMLAAIGDLRMIRAGGLRGTKRLARHLWRMCFGLFIASGSFFIGQMRFIPPPIRSVPLLIFLGVSPLLVLLYWLARIRLRKHLRGMPTANPIEATALLGGVSDRRASVPIP